MTNTENEIWRDIPNYEGLYQVSNLGNVKSLNYKGLGYPKNLAKCINNVGYYCVSLCKEKIKTSFNIHSLVAKTFLNYNLKDSNLNIDHINNDKLNNTTANLQIISIRENVSKDRKNKSSKYNGVHYDNLKNNWRSRILIGKKYVHIINSSNEKIAHIHYLLALENIKEYKGNAKFFRSLVKEKFTTEERISLRKEFNKSLRIYEN